MITKIGSFELGQSVEGLPLRKMDEDFPESQVFDFSKRMGMYKNLSQEDLKNLDLPQAYEAASVNMLGVMWTVVLGVMNGKIRKINLDYIADGKAEADAVLKKAVALFEANMGKCNKHPLFSKIYMWNSDVAHACVYKADYLNDRMVFMMLEQNFKNIPQGIQSGM